MIVDGKVIAENIYREIGEKLQGCRLGIVIVGNDPVIESFVRIKRRNAERLGVQVLEERLSDDATTADVIQAVATSVSVSDGVIVQLPLPHQIDIEVVLKALPHSHDVDDISLARGERAIHAPVATAMQYILDTYAVPIKGAEAVVVGAGRLVGKPCAELLQKKGVNVCILRDGDTLTDISRADIVVLGAGSPGLVDAHMLKHGAVLIDAGTSEQGGKVVGDADPTCAEVCSVFTPVPGGVGPIAVAMIFKNLRTLINTRQ